AAAKGQGSDLCKPTCRDIRSDHRFRHAAPADAREKQGVLRTEISKAPSFRTDDSEVASCRGLRPVRQDQLDVIAGVGSLRLNDRMRWCRNRDEFNSFDLILLQAVGIYVKVTADAQVGRSFVHQLRNGTERLDLQSQRHGWKSGFEIVENVDDALDRHQHVDRKRDLSLQPVENSLYATKQR